MQLDFFSNKVDGDRVDLRLKALVSRIADLKADMKLGQSIQLNIPLLMKFAS
jgi:hypothetical protein